MRTMHLKELENWGGRMSESTWIQTDSGIYGVCHMDDDGFCWIGFMSNAEDEQFELSKRSFKILHKEEFLLKNGYNDDEYNDKIIYDLNQYSGLQCFVHRGKWAEEILEWTLDGIYKDKISTAPNGIECRYFYYNNIHLGSNMRHALEIAREMGWEEGKEYL